MGSFCKSGTKTNTQTTDIPDYIKTPLKDNLAKAADLVKQEYIPYGGDRIQDFSQDQLDAFQQIRDRVGTGQADLDAAMAGIKSLSPTQRSPSCQRTGLCLASRQISLFRTDRFLSFSPSCMDE